MTPLVLPTPGLTGLSSLLRYSYATLPPSLPGSADDGHAVGAANTRVREVVLPYLNTVDRFLLAARDAADGALTGTSVAMLADIPGWFGSRGVERVNVFGLPHHGSRLNYDQSLPGTLPNACQFVAAAGPNNYDHPSKWVKQCVRTDGRQFVQVSDREDRILHWKHTR